MKPNKRFHLENRKKPTQEAKDALMEMYRKVPALKSLVKAFDLDLHSLEVSPVPLITGQKQTQTNKMATKKKEEFDNEMRIALFPAKKKDKGGKKFFAKFQIEEQEYFIGLKEFVSENDVTYWKGRDKDTGVSVCLFLTDSPDKEKKQPVMFGKIENDEDMNFRVSLWGGVSKDGKKYCSGVIQEPYTPEEKEAKKPVKKGGKKVVDEDEENDLPF